MRKPLNLIIVIGILAGLLVWTLILHVQTRSQLGEMRKVADKAKLTLLTFNMRKSDLHVELWQNRRDIYQNRTEIAKVRAIMIPPNYHITLIPLLVPDKLRTPTGMLKPLNLPKKGEANEQ